MKKIGTYFVEIVGWIFIVVCIYTVMRNFAEDAFGYNLIQQMAWLLGASIGSAPFFLFYALVIQYAREIRRNRCP